MIQVAEPKDMAAANAVAEAVRAAIILASMAEMDVAGPVSLKFDFAEDGAITVTAMDADGVEEDSGVIPPDAIVAFMAEDMAEDPMPEADPALATK